jgi:hypothetical protein
LLKNRIKLQTESEALIKEISELEEKRKQEITDFSDDRVEQLFDEVEKKMPLDAYLQEELVKYGIDTDQFKGLSKDELVAEVTSWVRFIKTAISFSPGKVALFSVTALILIIAWIDPGNFMQEFLPFLHNKVVAVFTIAGPFLITIQQTWKKLQKIYEPVKAYKDNFNKKFNELKAAYEVKKKQLSAELQTKTTELLAKNARIEALDNEIKSLHYDNAEYITQKAFVNFIERKAVDEEYKKALSIVSTIRKDFDVLSDLFRDYNIPKEIDDIERKKLEQKKTEADELKKLFKKPLDRIILYIDDLDRCPEERVIEVLEAVNLLMAFRLFVVVVGVDPRWVKNSLIKKYTLQFTGALNNLEHLEKHGVQPIHVTDYLEKIFQIPFHLNEAQGNGVSALLDNVFDGQILKEDLKESSEQEPKTTTSTFSFSKSTESHLFMNEPKEQYDTKLVHFRPEDLKISKQELQDLKDLAWLVGNNPRSVKRYANMYRIVRAHENLNYSEKTQRQDFLTVIYILGLSIGEFKGVAGAFYEFCAQNPDITLVNIIPELKDEPGKNLRKKMAAINLPENLKTLKGKDFNKYIPFVKRFSFENSMT